MRGPLLALAVLFAARLLVAGTTEIVEDEAYYWTWSERLAPGYFDHPPAVAWMIALSSRVLGATSIGVRAGAVLFGTLAAGLLLATPRVDRWLLLLLVGGLPLYTLGGVLATPDTPLLLGWALALFGAFRQNWLLAGLGAGLAGLSKYTGWGIWPLLLLGAPREWRRMLPGMALTLLCLAPNLAWNAAHGWGSVAFQAGHGLARTPRGGGLEFLAAQAGLVTPVLFAGIVAWWAVAWRGDHVDRVDRLCWWTSAPVLVFFALAATRTHGEANWAAPAWLGAAVGLSRASGRIARTAWVGGGFAAILSVAVVIHLYTPLVDIPGDPTARLGLGRAMASSVQAWGVEPVYTERYQEAALIRYHEGLETYALPGVGRPDQYDLWPTRWAPDALFVRVARPGDRLPSDPFCPERGPQNVVTERDPGGAVLDRWQVYEVHGCGAP